MFETTTKEEAQCLPELLWQQKNYFIDLPNQCKEKGAQDIFARKAVQQKPVQLNMTNVQTKMDNMMISDSDRNFHDDSSHDMDESELCLQTAPHDTNL